MPEPTPAQAAAKARQRATDETLQAILDTVEKQSDGLALILKLLREPPEKSGGMVEQLVEAVQGLTTAINGQSQQLAAFQATQEAFQMSLAQQVSLAVSRGIELAVGSAGVDG